MTAPPEEPDPIAASALEPTDDAEQAARAMADEAFRALYRDLVPRLVAFLITAYGASKLEAAECAHEALADYHRHQDTVRHPRAWCRRAARSIFLQRTYDALESFAELPATGAPLYAAAHADRAADTAQRDTLLPLLVGLPPQQREVIALLLEGLSHREIAAELDLAEATARSHTRHATARLAALRRAAHEQGTDR